MTASTTPSGTPAAPAAALEHLRVERGDDGVVLLTLDNPAQRNAMSEPMTASQTAASTPQPVTLATEDLQEGVDAARAKRPPRFTGR